MASKKNRSIAFLLAVFFGTIGAHRFYVGRGRTGLSMFGLTISFVGLSVSIPWALWDCVMIAVGRFRDKDGALVTEW